MNERSVSRRRAAQQRRTLVLGLLGAGAVLAIVVVVLLLVGGPPAVAAQLLADDPLLGSADAPVTIIEYGAYSCISCRAWHRTGVVGDILEQFAGQVAFTFRDFPVITPQYDRDAAAVAQCALNQDRDLFWTLHDRLYEDLFRTSVEEIITAAGEIGFDQAALQSCYDTDAAVRQRVEDDNERARALGLQGTPGFVVNGQVLYGASPEDLISHIESLVNS